MSAEFSSLLRSPLTVWCGEVTLNLFVSLQQQYRGNNTVLLKFWEKYYKILTKCFELVYFTTLALANCCPSSCPSLSLQGRELLGVARLARGPRWGVPVSLLVNLLGEGQRQEWAHTNRSLSGLPQAPRHISLASHYFVHLRVHIFSRGYIFLIAQVNKGPIE